MAADSESIYLELLVLRCRRGERRAFEELIRHFEKRLYYYVRRLTHREQDAWDVLQQTWLKVFQKLPSLRDPQSLSVWLYRIARNTAISHGRLESALRETPQDLERLDLAEENGEEFTEEDARRVHAALGRLPLPHREVLTLFFLEDMSIETIAQILDVPKGTVKSRLHYAKQSLRKELQDGESER